MPTHTHDFGNHRSGYGHSESTRAECYRITGNPILQRLQNLDSVLESMRIIIFRISNFLIGLGSVMICTRDLIVLTKIKETICYCQLFRLRWQNALDNHFYHSNGVSVPTEDIKHALNVSSNFVPTHAPSSPTLSC
jgi:hypothetical protein